MDGERGKPPIDDPVTAGEKPDKLGRRGAAKGGRPKGGGGTGERQSQSKVAKDARDAKSRQLLEAENHAKAMRVAPDVAGLLHGGFELVAARAGAHWRLTDEEADKLAYRIARVDMKYGGLLERFCEEIMLLGCCIAIGIPRVKLDRQLAYDAAAEKQAKVNGVETRGKKKKAGR